MDSWIYSMFPNIWRRERIHLLFTGLPVFPPLSKFVWPRDLLQNIVLVKPYDLLKCKLHSLKFPNECWGPPRLTCSSFMETIAVSQWCVLQVWPLCNRTCVSLLCLPAIHMHWPLIWTWWNANRSEERDPVFKILFSENLYYHVT